MACHALDRAVENLGHRQVDQSQVPVPAAAVNRRCHYPCNNCTATEANELGRGESSIYDTATSRIIRSTEGTSQAVARATQSQVPQRPQVMLVPTTGGPAASAARASGNWLTCQGVQAGAPRREEQRHRHNMQNMGSMLALLNIGHFWFLYGWCIMGVSM